ncbi:MAG: VOC family protein [Candidatus Methanomethylophilaceae archaeon]
MPLGDPHGGNFTYTEEGLPENIFAVMIPVKDVSRSIGFYRDILKMKVVLENEREAVVSREKAIFLLRRSQTVGVDTGVYIGVENPYDLHRRLIDEGVVFVRDPTRGPMGVYTSFRDTDSNVIHAIDMYALLD